MYRNQIDARDEGFTVLEYLARRYTHSSRSQWLERIHAAHVHLDEHTCAPDSPLRRGQWLTWNRPPWREPSVPTQFSVIAEDEGLLAVDKPCGLPTLPSGGLFLENTLLHLVRQRFPDDPGFQKATPVHRLDRGTSGLVLFARNEACMRSLTEQLRRGTVTREYVGLVQGSPSFERLVCTEPIGKVEWRCGQRASAVAHDGKPARTEVRVLERRKSSALVHVVLGSGRSHQIRIHLAAAGHALVGEPFYGAGGVPRSGSTATPGAIGYALHAHRLAFHHPSRGEPMQLESQLPAELRPSAS